MYFAHTDELRTAIRVLGDGGCASILSTKGGGKTTFLAGVAERLDARGIETIHVSGANYPASRPFESLELAGEIGRTSTPLTMSHVVDTLAEHFISQRTVLLVDDVASLDVGTTAALREACKRTGVPTLAAGQLGDTEVQAALALLLPSDTVRIELPMFSYFEVSEMVHAELGHAVSTDVLRYVAARSAGRPALINAIVRTAVKFQLFSTVNGVWEANGDLWHPALRSAVEQLTHNLTAAEQEALEVLSISGPMELVVATEAIGTSTLEALESRQLVQLFRTFGRPFVAVTPPLVSDYFKSLAPSVRRERLSHERGIATTNLPDSTADSSGNVKEGAFAGEALGSSSESRAALINLMHASQQRRQRIAWEAWQADHAVLSAVDFLSTAFEVRPDVTEVELVLAQTDRNHGDTAARAKLLALEAQWAAIGRVDVPMALRLLRTLPPEFDTFAAFFEARGVELELLTAEVPKDVEARFKGFTPQSQTDWHETTVARAAAFLIEGRPLRTLALLDSVNEPVGAVQRRGLEVLRGWALLYSGRCEEGFAWANGRREAAMSGLDASGAREHSYVATLAAMCLGRHKAAKSLMAELLALGSPALGQERLLIGTLSISALLATRSGFLETARSLAREAASSPVTHGPLPGMLASLPQAALLAFQHDVAGSIALLAESQLMLERNGFRLAAAALVHLTSENLVRPTESVLHAFANSAEIEIEGTFFASTNALEYALKSNDIDELIRLGSWFSTESRPLESARAYEAAQSHMRSDDDRLGDVQSQLAAILLELSRIGYSPRFQHQSAQAALSGRELEVARLAGQGLSNQEIAGRLAISPRTVESHVLRVFRKLDISTRSTLADMTLA